mgnify:CR=1 FL=1
MKTRSKVYEADGLTHEADGRIDGRKRRLNNAETSSSASHFTSSHLLNKDGLGLFDGTADLSSETFFDLTDLTSPNLLTAWQPGHYEWNETLNFNVSPLSPPVTPQPQSLSPPLEIPPFGTLFDSLPSESTLPLENTQLFEELVSGKRTKRELSKKCRKVYGIDNKKSWCTQCRWKKACTRFNG